ncbi:hypothetical protein BC941DRAFT_436776 [Chlamydoabsidia padenii]|nr:hypothetical protein BC941DRAFT_436776 [Chlamydoabsidia padenii]
MIDVSTTQNKVKSWLANTFCYCCCCQVAFYYLLSSAVLSTNYLPKQKTSKGKTNQVTVC